jgi:hypothetical protein
MMLSGAVGAKINRFKPNVTREDATFNWPWLKHWFGKYIPSLPVIFWPWDLLIVIA